MKKKYIVILSIFIFIYLLLGFVVKYRMKNIKQKELYTTGEVLNISHVQGSRTVDFRYFFKDKTYNGSSMEFSDDITQVGSKYFVIVNKKDIEQAYILGCCPYDEQKHFIPKEGLDKIPDEALQKKADEAFEEIFNSPLGRILPPW